MANKKQTHTPNLKSFVIAVIAILLAIIIAGTCISVVGYITRDKDGKWFNSLVKDSEDDEDPIDGEGITVSTISIPVELYGEYGISPIAETAYQIKATVKSASGIAYDTIQFVDFAPLEWATTNSANISDYVTLSVVDDVTANLTLIKGFSTQINLKISSRLDPTKSVTIPIDYARRLKGYTPAFYKNSASGSDTNITTQGQVIDVDFGHFDTITGTDNLWTYERFKFMGGYIYDSLGTVNDSVGNFGVEIKFSNEVYSELSNSNNMFHTMPESLSYVNSDVGKIGSPWSQTFLLEQLSDIKDTGVINYSKWLKLIEVLAAHSNQIEVTVSATGKYGGAFSLTYKLNCIVESPDIGSVEADSTGLVF